MPPISLAATRVVPARVRHPPPAPLGDPELQGHSREEQKEINYTRLRNLLKATIPIPDSSTIPCIQDYHTVSAPDIDISPNNFGRWHVSCQDCLGPVIYLNEARNIHDHPYSKTCRLFLDMAEELDDAASRCTTPDGTVILPVRVSSKASSNTTFEDTGATHHTHLSVWAEDGFHRLTADTRKNRGLHLTDIEELLTICARSQGQGLGVYVRLTDSWASHQWDRPLFPQPNEPSILLKVGASQPRPDDIMKILNEEIFGPDPEDADN
ncbi:hypothetical protein BDN72DRAFT_902488 [Pluteus cervinus]|uniref:Uncharacterized protein n=1 Tax=Pluteus cervinus TaxID=181527 RepID=A0ACD3ACL3_9AGAR|nr:hypothetical protein BDN72DRAFT_902488 [Pluteus cervinus]